MEMKAFLRQLAKSTSSLPYFSLQQSRWTTTVIYDQSVYHDTLTYILLHLKIDYRLPEEWPPILWREIYSLSFILAFGKFLVSVEHEEPLGDPLRIR